MSMSSASALDALRLHLHVALSGTASSHERAAAEAWLSSAATSSPGPYCDALLSLVAATASSSNPDDQSARFLAATQLKNVVARKWREGGGGRRATSGGGFGGSGAFSEEERARLRPLLLSWLLSEPRAPVASSAAAVAVAKAARHDWPSLWPSLLPELTAAATASSASGSGSGGVDGPVSAAVLRARLGLATVLKELASKRLSSDVRAFRSLAADRGTRGGSGGEVCGSPLLPTLWECFCDDTRSLVSSVSSRSAPPASASRGEDDRLFESWSLVLKSVRVLLVSGFSETEAAAAAAASPSDESGFGGGGGGPFPVPAVSAENGFGGGACAALSSSSAPSPPASSPCDSSPRSWIGARSTLKLLKAMRMISEAHPWSLVASGAIPAATRLAAALVSSEAREDSCEEGDDSGEDEEQERARQTSDKVVVESLLLLKAALSAVNDAVPPSPPKATSASAPAHHDRLSAARASVSSALPEARGALSGPPLVEIAEALVSKQMRLRPRADLSRWREDPEAWALSAESGASAWRESRRASAEALLSAAVAAERESLAPRLALALRETCARFEDALERAAESAAASTTGAASAASMSRLTSAALDKEAAAAAATVASYEIHDHVPFSEWLSADLLPDLELAAGAGDGEAEAAPAASATSADVLSRRRRRSLSSLLPTEVSRALSRRAALAIASWVPRATREDRMRCYPPLISLLGGGGGEGGGSGIGRASAGGGGGRDAAVALAAATALRSLVDDWDFVEEDFAPLSGSAFAAAARALGGGGGGGGATGGLTPTPTLLRDQESHVLVFGLVGVIVDRLPPGSVASHAPSLMQFLPAVWSSRSPSGVVGGGGSGSMLRVQCVSLLSRLLLSLGDDSPAAYPALLPMLSECLSGVEGARGEEGGDDLVEDGLGLWLVALRTAPDASGGGTPEGSRPLVAAGCAAAAAALERTSSTALAPLAAAGAGSAALLCCCGGGAPPSSRGGATAAVEFATMPEARLLCERLSLAAGETSERASMALVASADLIMASVTSPPSPRPPVAPAPSTSPPPSPSAAAISLLRGMLVRLTSSALTGRESPSVAGGVAALVARVVVAGDDGVGGGGAALASLAAAASAEGEASSKKTATASSSGAPPPSLLLVDLMIERCPSLPSGARKAVALALAALLGSVEALPTGALLSSVAEGNPAVAPWSNADRPSPRLLLPSIAEVLVGAFEEFEGDAGGSGDARGDVDGSGQRRHGRQDDDEAEEPLPLRFLFDSSVAEAAAVGGAGGDCSALSESIDAEGEARRRASLRRKGPIALGRISRAIASGAAAAAASRGIEAWGAALSALDPRLAGALRAAAERG